jgi:hypothetical protein
LEKRSVAKVVVGYQLMNMLEVSTDEPRQLADGTRDPFVPLLDVVATAIIGDYIDNFYNPQRRHSHLQYLGPIEFELRARAAAFAA